MGRSCAPCAYLPALIAVCAFLVTPAATLPSKLFVVCKNPETWTCLWWPIAPEEVADVTNEFPVIDKINCGLSKLDLTTPLRRFIKVRFFNEEIERKIFCKTINMKATEDMDWHDLRIRTRRNTGYRPRGKYRGQTQSQYLSVDRGNGKDEGKAEAHSAADSSRAIVSGNSGMGQAQSQTIYDPSCDECLSNPELDSANLSYRPGPLRPSGTNSPGYNYDSSQQGVPNRNSIGNGHFNQPGNLMGQNTPAGQSPAGSSGINIPYGASRQPNNNQPTLGNGQYNGPRNSIGSNNLPDGTFSQNGAGPSGNFGTPQQGQGTNQQIPSDRINQGSNNAPGGYPNAQGGSTYHPGSMNANQPNPPGNIIAQPGDTTMIHPNNGVGGLNNNQPGYFNNNNLGIPTGSLQQPGNVDTRQPLGQGTNYPRKIPDGDYLINQAVNPNSNVPQNGVISGNGLNGIPSTMNNNYNNGPGGTPPRSDTLNQPTSSLQPGSTNYPINKNGAIYPSVGNGNPAFIGQGNGINWPALSNLLPAGGAGSTYFCCVVSPSNQLGTNNAFTGHPYPTGQNQLPSSNGYYGYNPGSSQGNNGQNIPYNTGSSNLPNSGNGNYGLVNGPVGQNYPQGPGYTGPGQNPSFGPGGITQNGPYGNIGGLGQNPVTNGANQPGSSMTSNGNYRPGLNGQSGTYGPANTGQNQMTTSNGPYGTGNAGQNGGYITGTSNGQYGPGNIGQIAHRPGSSGQTGTYAPGNAGQNTMTSNIPYGSSNAGQNGPYGPGNTGQNTMVASNGPYGPGNSGQNGAYGPGTSIPSNSQYGPGNMGQNGAYIPGNVGQNTPYGPSNTGQNGGYSPGSVGQNTMTSNVPYGTSNAGQNGAYGPGNTGQNTMAPSNGPYGAANIGQNGAYGPGNTMTSPNVPYGPGNTGQNGPYGTGTVGQNTISSNGPYGAGTTGQNGPYAPGNAGQNTITSPNGPYGTGNVNQNGPYGPGNSQPYGGYRPENGGSLSPGGLAQYPNGLANSNNNGGQNNLQYPNGQYGQNYQPGVNNQPYGSGGQDQQINGLNNQHGGIPQNVLDPNSISSTLDDYDSEAQASVAQTINGTNAIASSKGGNKNGRAQTQVEGTYTGTGSFSANAEISDDNKAAQSHVSGSKKGASSSSEGRGRKNKSQASVKLGSETGSILTESQSSGDMHSSSSQVQGSIKGGMADAQAKGPGSTSSQAQIGFTPYKDQDKKVHDAFKTPFQGGGSASAQTSSRMGTSQSQLKGTFKYGITYNGGAQAGSSLDKDAVFSNLIPFDKIDVYDENNKNININAPTTDITTEIPQETTVDWIKDDVSTTEDLTALLDDLTDHNHSDHHKPINQPNSTTRPLPEHINPQNSTTRPPPEGNRRSFQPNYGTSGNLADYEYVTDKDDIQPEDYIDDGYTAENGHSEYNYDDLNRDPENTHQSLKDKKEIEVRQTTGGNTQHIILGSLQNHDAKIIQRNSEHPDERKIYQAGERVPGMGGYTIPVGFTGSVKSVASKEKTYVVGSKSSPSQAQTVTLTPGSGKVKYTYPSYYGKNVNAKDLRSLYNSKADDNRYVTVSKSVTRDLDNEDNIRRQYSHTYYTKSSSCGYFTFTCTMVSSAGGSKKVCRPKIPTNPDGSPMRC